MSGLIGRYGSLQLIHTIFNDDQHHKHRWICDGITKFEIDMALAIQAKVRKKLTYVIRPHTKWSDNQKLYQIISSQFPDYTSTTA